MPRLLWLAHHRPDIYRKAATITMISDWLAAKLSGELAVDPSNAGTTGMLDLFSRDWRPALLDMAGLRADMLSPVINRHPAGRRHRSGGAAERPARRDAGGDGRRRRPARLPGLWGGARRANRGTRRHFLAAGGQPAAGAEPICR